MLACARWEAAGPSFGSLRYLELSPDGEESCFAGSPCPVPTEPATWGSIKHHFRD